MKTDKTCICGSSCGIAGLILGAIFAVIIGYAYFTAAIPAIVTSVWISFAVAAAALAFLLIVLPISCCRWCERLTACLRSKINCLITGTIGTIITSLAALSIDLSITGEPGRTALIGVGAFFFMYLIVALVSLFKCFTKKPLK